MEKTSPILGPHPRVPGPALGSWVPLFWYAKKQAHFQTSSRDEVFASLFFFFSSRDEISSQQKRVNSKRHFNIDRDDFVPGRVSFQDEISRVNTVLDRSVSMLGLIIFVIFEIVD